MLLRIVGTTAFAATAAASPTAATSAVACATQKATTRGSPLGCCRKLTKRHPRDAKYQPLHSQSMWSSDGVGGGATAGAAPPAPMRLANLMSNWSASNVRAASRSALALHSSSCRTSAKPSATTTWMQGSAHQPPPPSWGTSHCSTKCGMPAEAREATRPELPPMRSSLKANIHECDFQSQPLPEEFRNTGAPRLDRPGAAL
mmetsp:Transcript_110159/g.351068  ORF Transcript_110159/g.351068 Transcript_110159/m.351068 type:complete len:202 (-) Transcript_110159:1578-2183(-)